MFRRIYAVLSYSKGNIHGYISTRVWGHPRKVGICLGVMYPTKVSTRVKHNQVYGRTRVPQSVCTTASIPCEGIYSGMMWVWCPLRRYLLGYDQHNQIYSTPVPSQSICPTVSIPYYSSAHTWDCSQDSHQKAETATQLHRVKQPISSIGSQISTSHMAESAAAVAGRQTRIISSSSSKI